MTLFIHCKVFEAALVKIEDGKVKIGCGRGGIYRVTVATQDIKAESDNTFDFAESVLKKRKLGNWLRKKEIFLSTQDF